MLVRSWILGLGKNTGRQVRVPSRLHITREGCETRAHCATHSSANTRRTTRKGEPLMDTLDTKNRN